MLTCLHILNQVEHVEKTSAKHVERTIKQSIVED